MTEGGTIAARARGVLTPARVAVAAGAVALVAVAAQVLPLLIPKPPEELYLQDRERLQKAVLVHITGYSPTRARYLSANRFDSAFYEVYPTWARSKAGKVHAIEEADVDSDEITSLLQPQSNPTAGKERSGTPSWEDADGDGRRVPADDALYYHLASPEPSVDHWNTTGVTVDDTGYVVDSRDWFMNVDDLVDRDYLKELPASVSPDNSADGTGSYSWYVDAEGTVKSMLYGYPVAETDGYQGIYP